MKKSLSKCSLNPTQMGCLCSPSFSGIFHCLLFHLFPPCWWTMQWFPQEHLLGHIETDFKMSTNLHSYWIVINISNQFVSYYSLIFLIHSCGGNLLMNVGPSSDGTISTIFQERLTQMGDWLKVNGDAIYKSRPWKSQKDSVSGNVW